MKVGTFLCNCGGSLNKIDWDQLKGFVKEKTGSEGNFCAYHENLCSPEGKAWFKETIGRERPGSIVFGGCTPKTAGYLFENTLKEVGISPYQVVGANLREHIGWVCKDSKVATQNAKAAVLSAYNKAAFVTDVDRLKINITDAAVVIGAGPAGTQAAQDLAEKGHRVHLIEKNPYLGGNAVKLGTFFPSEDCATCMPTPGLKGIDQSNVRRCYYRSALDLHPNVSLHIRSEVTDITGDLGNYSVAVNTKPTYVKMDRCVNCGECVKACPVEKPNEIDLGLTKRKAIYLPVAASPTTKYVVNRDECPAGCTECQKACPVDAIDLNMQEVTQNITAGGFVLATGFEEYNPALVEEYHYGVPGYENVVTQSELARLLDIAGPTQGELKKKNGEPVKNLVIINCVGSRSEKYNIWCSNICCMIGIKHAIKVKEKYPNIDVICCYIDIRTVGNGYEEFYNKARALGVKFIRGRPAEVETDGTTLYVSAEDSQADTFVTLKADMVALSMSMVASSGIKELATKLKVDIADSGYFKAVYSKFKTTETKKAGVLVAGTAIAPADIPTTLTRAGYAASQLETLLSKGSVEKKFPTAVVDNDKCTLCELCVTACPYGAMELVPVANPGTKVQVNANACLGCGQCVSTCPVNCIKVDYYEEDQILKQVEGLLFDVKENPESIIVTFACWECAYSATDAVGMSIVTKSADLGFGDHVRIVPIQCTGNVSARLIRKTFDMGAEGILVLGCYEDRCHYDSGSQASSIRVTLLKQMLKDSGINPDRLEKETVYYMSADRFSASAKKMAQKLKELGKLDR